MDAHVHKTVALAPVACCRRQITETLHPSELPRPLERVSKATDAFRWVAGRSASPSAGFLPLVLGASSFHGSDRGSRRSGGAGLLPRNPDASSELSGKR